MDIISYILKICYHLICTIIIYWAACKDSNRKVILRAGNRTIYSKINPNTLLLSSTLIICLLEGIYSFICGPYHVYLVDRGIFANRFARGIYSKTASLGLYYIQVFLREFTTNPDVLFFVVAVIFMFATLTAYNKSKDARPMALLYMCMSQYMLYGCYQLKQALATSFTAIAIVCFLEKKYLWCVLSVALAISFHEAAFVLLPLIFALYGSKSKTVKYLSYAFLVLFVLFFTHFSRAGIGLFTRLIPEMSNQVSAYLDETGGFEATGSILTAIKGFPIYYITYMGITNRNNVKENIKNIDKYLLVCVYASAATMASAFMPWMWRFSELVYIPVFLFAALLRENLEEKKKREYDLIICLSLAFFTYRKLIISYFTYGGII